jgi:hypothetical protein
MKRKTIFLIAALVGLWMGLLTGVLWASNRGLAYHYLQVYDEDGREVTDITSVTVMQPGTDTAQTIYKDKNLTLAITQPMTTSSTNFTLVNGHFKWYGANAFDLKVTSTTLGSATYRGLEQSRARVQLPKYMPQLAGLAWVTVELSNADVLALRATPKEIIAAPGAGYMIDPVEAVLILDYGTAAFTETTANLIFGWNAGAVQAGEIIEATAFITATADTITNWIMLKDELNAASTVVNKNLCLKNNGAAEYGVGTGGTMTVSIFYRIVPVGL